MKTQLRKIENWISELGIEVNTKLKAETKTYIHITGKVQTCDEYLADVESGALSYSHAIVSDIEVIINSKIM